MLSAPLALGRPAVDRDLVREHARLPASAPRYAPPPPAGAACLADLRESREVRTILRGLTRIVTRTRLPASELGEPEHTRPSTGQFGKVDTRRLVEPQHATCTQRYVHLSPIAADDEGQLESNRISLVARPTVLICFRGVLPALGFE